MKRARFYVGGGLAVAAFATALIGLPSSAAACAIEPYLGSVCYFAGAYCPEGYTPADGRLLPIKTDSGALYSVIGTTYGGDGRENFALPDLRGRVVAAPDPRVGLRIGDVVAGAPSVKAMEGDKNVQPPPPPALVMQACIASSLSYARYPVRPN